MKFSMKRAEVVFQKARFGNAEKPDTALYLLSNSAMKTLKISDKRIFLVSAEEETIAVCWPCFTAFLAFPSYTRAI